jgi:hypothetical protein
MSALTPAKMVRDSYVTFSPTSLTSDGGTYTFDQIVDDKFFAYAEITSTTNATFMKFVVSAGSTTIAWQLGLGSLSVTLTSTGKTTPYRALIGPLESARFMGSTGAITITASSSLPTGVTGFIGIAKMPYVDFS